MRSFTVAVATRPLTCARVPYAHAEAVVAIDKVGRIECWFC
jgi:hypothetical protein